MNDEEKRAALAAALRQKWASDAVCATETLSALSEAGYDIVKVDPMDTEAHHEVHHEDAVTLENDWYLQPHVD